MKNKNSILIIGGTGFIGYHLAKNFLKKKWKVTSLSNHKPKKTRFLKKAKYIVCDISKKKSLQNKIKQEFNYVINSGGYVDHSNKKKTYLSHYIGVKNLSNLFKKKKLKLFIQLGSGGENGKSRSPHAECLKKLKLKNYYKAKLLATNYLLKFYKKFKFPVVILRLYQVYGPQQDINRIIPITIFSCLKNEKFKCTTGNQKRDFIHVDDVVAAINKTIKAKNITGNIFNIGFGRAMKLKNIILKINNLIGAGKPLFGAINLKEGEQMEVYPSIQKAKKLIGWCPKISLLKGIKKTIKYYKKTYKACEL